MLQKYATGKYDPEKMMPYEIVKTVKRHNIDARSNFLIGFRDELGFDFKYKNFAKNLLKRVLIKLDLLYRYLCRDS